MKNQNKDTVILYTYKYIWQDKDGKLCVKFITGVQDEHAKFQKAIKDDNNIARCYREYVSQVDMSYFGFTEEVKQIKKKESEQENETN